MSVELHIWPLAGPPLRCEGGRLLSNLFVKHLHIYYPTYYNP